MGIPESKIDHKCPSCESLDTIVEAYEDSFQYGDDDTALPIVVEIPLYKCKCGFEWFDWKAEIIKDAAVREYLLRIRISIQDELIIILNKALDIIEARCNELLAGASKYVQ